MMDYFLYILANMSKKNSSGFSKPTDYDRIKCARLKSFFF
jgi:hypothetical protein